MKRRLDLGCAVAAALFDRATTDARPEVRLEALELLERSELPTAVFDAATRSPKLLSATWRELFGTVDADAAVSGGDGSSSSRHLAELSVIVVVSQPTAAEEPHDNRLKDQFLATVAHELRAPLTTMLLWEKVLRDEPEEALRVQALDAIRQSALTQSRVVGDLLDISRAINGKLFVDLRAVEIERVVRGAFEAGLPHARAKQITLERGGTVVGEVEGDAVRLRQVLDNLIANAVKFTDPGGKIHIAVSFKGPSIVITVEDTGRGIAPAFLLQMFEPFSQIEDALPRRSAGLGLGLAISKELVDLHHGSLVASSPGEGRGSTFTLTLPLATRGHVGAPSGVARSPKLDGLRILVIDDDRRVREALDVLLDHAGATIDTADSADAARARIATHAPKVIVCDIAMPVEDGYTFIRGLRAAGNSVAAIALTAYATDADAERARAAGFDRHLAKPIEIEQLVASIDELVHDTSHVRPR